MASANVIDRFLRSIISGPLVDTARQCREALKVAQANAPMRDQAALTYNELCKYNFEQ